MGGMLIICSTVISVLLWAKVLNRFILVLLFSTVYLGVLGFFDDYFKVHRKSSRGVSIRDKFIFQIILAVIIASYLYFFPPNPKFATQILIPYLKEAFLELGWLYIFFSYLIVIGSTNAVNITDGLDGLAIGVSIVSYATYGIFAYVGGNVKFAEYLKIIYVPGGGEISIFIASVIGAGLGFLWYNSYPATIFMGDIGSLFLGGVLGIIALLIKQEILLFLVGGVFITEILSVVLQVYFFRKRGRRIFKMAPLHHHFEMQNVPEPKITIRFWIVNIIFCLIALGALKIR
jgi:phospho-N-acetylmuramoyl-pentapeptide-transferase